MIILLKEQTRNKLLYKGFVWLSISHKALEQSGNSIEMGSLVYDVSGCLTSISDQTLTGSASFMSHTIVFRYV
jgi:hypothetical protein